MHLVDPGWTDVMYAVGPGRCVIRYQQLSFTYGLELRLDPLFVGSAMRYDGKGRRTFSLHTTTIHREIHAYNIGLYDALYCRGWRTPLAEKYSALLVFLIYTINIYRWPSSSC